jgi:hypothetical protein
MGKSSKSEEPSSKRRKGSKGEVVKVKVRVVLYLRAAPLRRCAASEASRAAAPERRPRRSAQGSCHPCPPLPPR